MISLKEKTRATITSLTVAALATTIFAGCAPSTPNTSSGGTSSTSSTTSSSSATTSISENSTPGGSSTDGEGIKFKYWYENNKSSESENTSGTATGDLLFGSNALPIYQDDGGNKFVGSDFKHISVDDEGNISSTDAALLRDEDNYKIYLMEAPVEIKDGFTMPSFEELKADDLAEGSVIVDASTETAKLYVNGIFAGEIESPTQIDLSSIFSIAANIGSINFGNGTATVSFGTAVDIITVTFTPQADEVAVAYDTNDVALTIPSSAISYNFSSTTSEDNYLSLSPEFIEKVLGYHIISSTASDGTLELNVITDTKDELKDGNVVAPSAAEEHLKETEKKPTGGNTSTSSQPTESQPTSSSDTTESKPTESTPTSGSNTESKPASSSNTTSSSKPTTSSNTSSSTPPQSAGKPTAAAQAAIDDPKKAMDPSKSKVTTSNTVNTQNTPGYQNSAKDNESRYPTTVNGLKYWVDDNGVYYNTFGDVVYTYDIGKTQADIDAAVEKARRDQAAGKPIGEGDGQVAWDILFG